MDQYHLLQMLSSDQFHDVNDALVALRANLIDRPGPQLSNKVLGLCLSENAEIKELAIRVAGTRWHLVEALPLLANVLSTPYEDDLVLMAALNGICDIGRNEPCVKNSALRILAHFALNAHVLEEAKYEAYALTLWLSGNLSLKEFLRIDPEEWRPEIDTNLLLQYARYSQ